MNNHYFFTFFNKKSVIITSDIFARDILLDAIVKNTKQFEYNHIIIK